MNKELTTEILKRSGMTDSGPLAAALGSDIVLSDADYLTIRDLERLSGYTDPELQALLLCMFMSVSEGSICLKLQSSAIAEKLGAFLDKDEAVSFAGRIIKIDLAKKYPELVSENELDYKPLILKDAGVGKFLYFQKFPRYESELKEELASHINYEEVNPLPLANIKDALLAISDKEPVRIGGAAVKLNAEQKIAVCLSLLKNFVIISGGPGTGKTSIVITILRALTRLGISPDEMCMTAPTGRAAQRLSDSIQKALTSISGRLRSADEGLRTVQYGTIHRILGYNPFRDNFTYNSDSHLPVKVVIIDEVSMIDIVLMARLFEALEPGTKVVLLGDKDQLPSVDAGAVLADLMPKEDYAVYSDKTSADICKIDPGLKSFFSFARLKGSRARKVTALTDRVVILKKSYRSGEGILKAASAVNSQDLKIADELPALPVKKRKPKETDAIIPDWPAAEYGKPGCYFLEAGTGDIRPWHKILDSWISMRYFSKPHARTGIKYTYKEFVLKSAALDLGNPELKDHDFILKSLFWYIENGKILTFIKRGPFGTFAINRYIARRLYPELGRGMRGRYFAGAPVMITENDPVHELYNGDVGIVLRSKKGSYYAVFQRLGAFISLSLSELPLSETAFAITVHKSQGSEYDNVFLALPPDENNRLLSKEIVYTALTRARQSVVIYGSRDVLRAAIGRKIERQSGLKLWG